MNKRLHLLRSGARIDFECKRVTNAKKKGFREKGVAKSSGEVMREGRCLEDFRNSLRPNNVPGVRVSSVRPRVESARRVEGLKPRIPLTLARRKAWRMRGGFEIADCEVRHGGEKRGKQCRALLKAT